MACTISPPDLSIRPLKLAVERTIRTSPDAVYRAFTTGLDRWFAPGVEVVITPEVDAPYFFQLEHEGKRYTHYGRFLRLEPGSVVEQTWVTGEQGTRGEETVVTIGIVPLGEGTRVRVTHAGLPNQDSHDAYLAGWPQVLAELDRYLASP